MTTPVKNLPQFAFTLLLCFALPASGQDINELIRKEVSASLTSAELMYRDLHQNPELSLQETRTAARMAQALEKLGFEVTTGVGGNGVVGVLSNGSGPVIMLRTDMDALPVKETTGLPWASKVTVTDLNGTETSVMHACGHDFHMTVWHGTLTTLVSLKERWRGTIVAVAQPAEEVSGGSEQMIDDGLYTRFPVPDYALCYHVSSDLPAGTTGYCPGPIFAGVKSVDIKVFGIGGHGAMPHKTIDPIVLSARIILDYQTIVSREINPVSPAVVTVGSIHGGTKHNIIPEEVDMKLTIRFFSDDVGRQIIAALRRIADGQAAAAGLKADRMPLITTGSEYTPPVENDPDLVSRATESMSGILGKENVIRVNPSTVAEDFGKYGRTPEKVKIALFWLGGVNRAMYKESQENGTMLPALHSSNFLPDFVPAYSTGVT
ncbi:amidohydrolase, partial [bacterium]|nr:amidohydrolase [bacterium]